MAVHKSALKEQRKNIRRARYNTKIKTNIKTIIKELKTAIREKREDEAKRKLAEARKYLDKAVTQGVLHRNNASRKISRLTIQLNKFLTSVKS